MTNARRYECFAVDADERLLYAGNISGQISTVDIDSFAVLREDQAHFGIIHAIAVHPTLPYLASLGNDRVVAIWRIGPRGELSRLAQCSVRDLVCSNDDGAIDPIFSHSVALGFHDRERRLVTRTGNGGTVELAFDDDGTVTQRWALRLHGDWDVQMTRFVAGGDGVLSAGRDASLVLVEDGIEKRRWRFGDVVAHWAEHLSGTRYLVASDLGLAARVDIASDAAPEMGARFAHDDMEFLTYNRTSGRAFGTSFDRNVYEINPDTLEAIGIAYSPGYKCIWAKSLERAPSILIVQSRNGGLYKADLDTGATLGVLKDVPDALWSAVVLPNGDVLAGGEGDAMIHYEFAAVDPSSRAQRFEPHRLTLPMAADSYTKRVLLDPVTQRIAFARTDGDIWAGTIGDIARIANVGSAVRDICHDQRRDRLLAATEDGRIVAMDWRGQNVATVFQDGARPFARAIWALAYNPARDLIAFAEFGKTLHIVNAGDMSPVTTVECQRVKRIRWSSPTTLLLGSSDTIVEFDIDDRAERLIVEQMQNTVEDFIWDRGRRYMLAICYQCTIGLFDHATGQRLDHVRDQLDYSKGIAWLDPVGTDAYPMDFITWGRSGQCHQYRVHNERIVALGPLPRVEGSGESQAATVEAGRARPLSVRAK